MNYFDVYKDVWELHKKYQQVSTSEEYWEKVINEGRLIAKKYDNSKFVMDLVLTVLEELERQCKQNEF